jgi:hypothetical protein
MDSQYLFTGETDPRDDSGWISVRDRRTLQRIAQWPTHGIEPHDLKLEASGALLVANGGIRRTRNDRKRDLDRMESSLARFDSHNGKLLGKWQLEDPRLSLRHMAWGTAADGLRPLLGIGIQAEHTSDVARQEAPVLAVWDGRDLTVPSHAADAVGYAGDITPAACGGFVLSSNKVNGAFWWRPDDPAKLTLIAHLTEAYALSTSQSAAMDRDVVICFARGAALWHPHKPASLLLWPKPMVMENHWTTLTSMNYSLLG